MVYQKHRMLSAVFAMMLGVCSLACAQTPAIPLETLVTADKSLIELPEGTFTLGPTSLKLKEGVEIRGRGAKTVIEIAEGTEQALVLQSGNVLSHLKISAAKAREGNVNDALILVRGAEDVEISNVFFDTCPRTCIVTDHVKNMLIKDCRFIDIGLSMNLQFSHDIKVEGNYVRNAKLHGMQFWGNWNWQNQDCSNIQFVGNTIIDGGAGAIWGAGGKRIVMANNIIDGAVDVGLDLEWCTDSTITGNTVRRCKNGGIALFFSCENIAITGNSVLNDYPIEDEKATWWVRSGIWLTYTNKEEFKNDTGHKNVTIVGNSITCATGQRRAVWVGSGSNIVIANNALRAGKVWIGGEHKVPLLKLQEQPDNVTIGKQDLPPVPQGQAMGIASIAPDPAPDGQSGDTFKTVNSDTVFWNEAWVAQSVVYKTPVEITSLRGLFKDGATNNKYTFQIFTGYDGKGGFSGELAKTTATITPNSDWSEIKFDAPVILKGSANGVYYIKWSPAEGGGIHQHAQWGDEFGDTLRMGSQGHLIVASQPAGVDAPKFRYDALLTITTKAVQK